MLNLSFWLLSKGRTALHEDIDEVILPCTGQPSTVRSGGFFIYRRKRDILARADATIYSRVLILNR